MQSTPSLDSVDCTIVTPLQLSLLQFIHRDQLLFSESEQCGLSFVESRARGFN